VRAVPTGLASTSQDRRHHAVQQVRSTENVAYDVKPLRLEEGWCLYHCADEWYVHRCERDRAVATNGRVDLSDVIKIAMIS